MHCNETDLSESHSYDVVITSQANIEHGALRALNSTRYDGTILVKGANDTLSFTNLTKFYRMDINCNSKLQKIVFPERFVFDTLNITEAPALTEINMNKNQRVGSGDRSGESLSNAFLNIIKAPQLGRNPEAPSQQINAINAFFKLNLDNAGQIQFPNLTSAGSISVSNSDASFPKLETVYGLNLGNQGFTSFPNLMSSSGDVYIDNLRYGSGNLLGDFSLDPNPDLVIQKSLVIGPRHPSNQQQPRDNSVVMDQVTAVGEDLNITNISRLIDISFSHLREVKRLHIVDNPNSTITGDFSSLSNANSIYINGIINTTISPALFPRLAHAGEVIIEALNTEFDCSRLVQMRNLGVIQYLSCNGTNGTNNKSTGLSTAASAGIGVGVGIAALGIITILVWRAICNRRKVRSPNERPNNIREDGLERTVREAPKPQEALLDDTQIREAGGRPTPYQVAGGEILEAGGRAVRAEAADERIAGRVAVASPQQKKTSPVELP
ncbi:hypothetical protein PG999_001802 [Apiospora kogelbergensis]|uniref:Receptor L-domain domain-containing protein n=1 Tax=Apiospora kogelbergensis TaxID=1337665 RepID=A0AAW0R6B8_9PEZI